MARDQIITARVTGDRGTVVALRRLPRQADQELREANRRLAQAIAAAAAQAARSDSRQSALMAPTIRVQSGRGGLPAVVAGGNTLVGRRHKPAHKILFGSEFGSNRLKQYRPHLGSGSYWFLRTVEAQAGVIAAEHDRAAARLDHSFSKAA